MRRAAVWIFLISTLFCTPFRATATARVEAYQLWRTKPPDCNAALSQRPDPVTAFFTTDKEAFLWFYITGLAAGDVVSTEYYQPNGVLYAPASGPFSPLASGGNYCFTDVAFTIASAAPANLPGQWTIRATLNGQQIFTMNFTIAPPGSGGTDSCSTMTIDGKANIFAAGRTSAFNGQLPPGCRFQPGAGKILTFRDVTGGAACISTALNGPDGGGCAGGNTNINSYQGIAGLIHSRRTMFLVGVFLDDRVPADPAPARLDFTNNDAYTTLAPLIGQVFFIGDGLTGTGAGQLQQVQAPATATRIFLGIADAYSFQGNPGAYDDNIGSFRATPVFGAGTPVPQCSYALSSTNPVVPAAGGNVTITVTATSGCPWTATSHVPWMSFPGTASGTGNGSVTFQVQAHTGASARSGTLNIAGVTVNVTQNGTSTPACTYTISPTSVSPAASGSTGSITVTAGAGCAWTAVSNASWLTITAGASGSGNGRVDYAVAANTVTSPRTGTVTVAGRTLTVTQAAASGGGTPGCSYFVNPSSQSISGAGGTGLVLVNTAANCSWTARSNVSWIVIEAGSSGTGSGAVSYRVAANLTSSPRSGTLTIAGQTYTVNQAAGSSCTYSLSPSSASFGAGSGSGGFLVTTQSGCAWTASTAANWITVNSSAGNGTGNVSFSVAANPNPTPRTGSIAVGSASFSVNQAAGGAASGPAVTTGGIVNAASFMPASLPGGAIAQGSFFSIFGTALGPKVWVKAETYPLPATLGGVSIRVSQGSRSVSALPVFVSETQINAVMPSNAPIGAVEVTVTYDGKTSAAASARVAASNFGIFTTAGGRGPAIVQNYKSAADQPLNTRSEGIKPGQVGTLWGTGLGPITGPDNQAPPVGDLPVQVQVYIGGKEAKKLYSGRAPCCAGVDQIVFETPADAPRGCSVPVQIKAGGGWSNSATIAVTPGGAESCYSPNNPAPGLTSDGGKVGGIFLVRGNATVPLESGAPPSDVTLDLGLAAFTELAPGGDLAYNPLFAMPPVGSCTVLTGEVDLGKALGADLGAESPLTGKPLDAGQQITLTGPGGTRQLVHTDEEKGSGPYAALLGGKIPIGDAQEVPPFLNAGTFTVSGAGGRDVGPFSAQFTMRSAVTWTNRTQLASINRTNDLTLTWTGGQANQVLLVAGVSQDQTTDATAGFVCYADAAAGRFTVPASTLANLPASKAEETGDTEPGVLLFGTLPAGEYPKFQANGLTNGFVFPMFLQLHLAPYR